MATATPISVDSIVSTSKDLVFSNVADEVVILDLKSGVYHGLEAVGARAWELMTEPRPVRDVRDKLLEEYDVDPQQCESDLLRLIEELESHGLLDVHPAP